MSVVCKVIFALIIIFQVNAIQRVRHWAFDNGDKWINMGRNSDCSKTRAVVTKQLDGVMFVNGQKEYQEFVLPSDGAVLIGDNSRILFSANETCKNAGEDDFMMFKHSTVRRWFSSKSWVTIDEKKSVAQPHIEQIPCECDTIFFPEESGTAVDLEGVDELVVDKIYINGHIDNFNRFLETNIGQKMFLNSEDVRFTRGLCSSRPAEKLCGCHTHKRFFDQLGVLCKEENEYCEIPHCIEPIKPVGHCCDICGGILLFKSADVCDIDVKRMSQTIESKLNRFRNGKYSSKINFYINIIPDRSEYNRLQLTIAEVGDYTGISIEFLDYLRKDSSFRDDNGGITRFASGMAYSPTGASLWFIVFTTLLFVLSVYGTIYVYYIKQPKMPEWVPIARLNALRSSIVFARFDNRQIDEDAESVINVGVRFNEEGRLLEKSTTGFNNPLFQQDGAPLSGPSEKKIKPTIVNTDSQSDTDDDDSQHDSDVKINADETEEISLNLVDISLKSDEK